MQLPITILIVCIAGLVLLRATWKLFARPKPGCGSGCGKCASVDSPEQKDRFPLPQV